MVHFKIERSGYAVYKHKYFRRKSLEGNGRGRIKGRKGERPAWIFLSRGPRVSNYANVPHKHVADRLPVTFEDDWV